MRAWQTCWHLAGVPARRPASFVDSERILRLPPPAWPDGHRPALPEPPRSPMPNGSRSKASGSCGGWPAARAMRQFRSVPADDWPPGFRQVDVPGQKVGLGQGSFDGSERSAYRSERWAHDAQAALLRRLRATPRRDAYARRLRATPTRDAYARRPRTRSRPATRAASFGFVAQRAVWLNPQSGTSERRSSGTPAASSFSMRSATSSAVSM